MWPFDRTPSRTVVRVAVDRVESWVGLPGAMEMTQACTIERGEERPSAERLEQALGTLLGARPAAETGERLTCVVESAWMPVLPLEAGPALWSTGQLKALLNHRLSLLHAGGDAPPTAWDQRLDFEPGNALGVGYALPYAVKAALRTSAAARGHSVHTIEPAWSWMWQRRGRRGTGGHHPRWWVLVEADRLLVARLDARYEVDALEPCAAGDPQHDAVERVVDAAAFRAGLARSSSDVIAVLHWEPPGPSGSTRVQGKATIEHGSMAARGGKMPPSAGTGTVAAGAAP